MQNKFAEVAPRNFNSMWAPRLSDEARKAVNAAFDAMSTWRIETANDSEKNREQVIEDGCGCSGACVIKVAMSCPPNLKEIPIPVQWAYDQAGPARSNGSAARRKAPQT